MNPPLQSLPAKLSAAAFANTGAVLIGVSDAGKIAGVTLKAETLQGWINQKTQSRGTGQGGGIKDAHTSRTGSDDALKQHE